MRVTQLCAQASCLPRVGVSANRAAGRRLCPLDRQLHQPATVARLLGAALRCPRLCRPPGKRLVSEKVASFPKSSSASPRRPRRSAPDTTPARASAPAFAGRQAPGRAGPGSSGRCRRARDGADATAGPGSKPDSAACSHLLLVKFLIFWSFSDLIGKMETIIRAKKGFRNSARMYGAHAASCPGRIPLSHWRLLLFGFFRSPGGPSPSGSLQDPSLWPFTYCLLSLESLAVTAFIPSKCSPSYVLDTHCVHVACWGCRNHSAAGPVPWVLMAE